MFEFLFFLISDVTLYPIDREIDIEGDIQSPLQWKTRTVVSKEHTMRNFLYAELSEKEPVHLTKMNLGRKLLYNKQLCQLVFRTNIEVRFRSIITCNATIYTYIVDWNKHRRYSSHEF